jgi:mRNA-degrading endonuclease RelE of RelBE toxin-antitoxin system
MEKRIKFTLEARESFRKLHIDIQRLIKSSLKKLVNGSAKGKPLTENLKGLNSLREGNYRIIYHESRDMIVVFDVGHRKNIYEKK